MKKTSKYEQQAIDFAAKHDLTMTSYYAGHRARFSKHITATWLVTLSRLDRKPWSFEFSTSINDSWEHTKEGKQYTYVLGLPPRIDLDKFFASPEAHKESFSHRGSTVRRCKKQPSLYDILACITKYDPKTFEDFCSSYGYDTDSRKAEETYFAVQKEWQECNRMFHDCLDELQEIN
jgi:hypothetical protein